MRTRRSTSLSVLGVIPARYASTRLPAKPLASILGKPMIQWVYEAASQAIKNVVVATDDNRIVEVVRQFGGEAILTPSSCASGTERMAWVARKRNAFFYVNVQGDEPLIHPDTIRQTVKLALAMKAITTPVTRLRPEDEGNPNVVKVALGEENRALYFSRSFIPFPRDGKSAKPPVKHLGLYVYPRAELLRFVKLPSCPLEKTEKLEQLRALYHGMPIFTVFTRHDSIGVDTKEDLKSVVHLLKTRRKISGE